MSTTTETHKDHGSLLKIATISFPVSVCNNFERDEGIFITNVILIEAKAKSLLYKA
jgi:hypothetical protein